MIHKQSHANSSQIFRNHLTIGSDIEIHLDISSAEIIEAIYPFY